MRSLTSLMSTKANYFYKKPLLLIFVFLLSHQVQAQCPIQNFHNPVISKTANLGKTSQESYFLTGGLHAGLDIIDTETTPVYSSGEGVLSIFDPYPKRPGTDIYMDSLKLDHGDGIVSIYTHINVSNIPASVMTAIKNQTPIPAGTKISTMNFGSGGILPHLHFTIIDEVNHEIHNPLSCITITDDISPEIGDLIVVSSKDSLKTQPESHYISLFGSVKLFSPLPVPEVSAKNLTNQSYFFLIQAGDQINESKRPFHIHDLKVSVSIKSKSREILINDNHVFNASKINCGYECITENLWENNVFIEKEKTAYDTAPFTSMPQNNLYTYRVMEMNPCSLLKDVLNSSETQTSILFKVQAKDTQDNYVQKIFQLSINNKNCSL